MRIVTRSWVVVIGLALCALVLAAVGVAAQETDGQRLVRAAHILASPDDDPGAAQTLDPADPAWEEAEASAIAIAAEVRAIPDPAARAERFAELARELSDDTFSGAQGGDLGAFSREMMVPEFEDPIFDGVGLEPGDILGPVRSDFGWHVILYQGEGMDPDATALPDPEVAPAATPGLTLEDAGAEPRAMLVFAPAAGSTATVTFSASSDATITIEGLAPMETSTSTTMTWDAAVTDVAPDGTTRTDLTLTDVSVDELEGLGVGEDAYREQMAGMVGLSGWTVTDASGTVIDSGVDLPDGLDPVLGQAFRQTIAAFSQAPAAFPDEPVGVGATWTSVAVSPATDLATASVAEVVTTITAIDGSRVSTTAVSTATSEMGAVTYPGLPEGTEVMVLEGEGTSTGTMTMDLTTLHMTSTVRSDSTTRMAIELNGQLFPMDTVTTVEMTMTAE